MSNQVHNWKSVYWGDLATLEYGKAFREYKEQSGLYPVYGTNGQIGWHNEYLYPKAGIIVGRKGAYRGIHFSKQPFFVIDTAFYLKPKDEKALDIQWAYYQLLNFDINKMDSGAAIPSTSREAFYALSVQLPNISIQQKIASILSVYDDLMENNTRRIKILEEMTKTIYDEWFVKFRFPDYEKVKMVESELGPIPQGWKVEPVGELLSYYIGGGWGKESPDNKYYKKAYVIRGTDILDVRRGKIDSVPRRFHTKSSLKTRVLQKGDIIFEVSGGSKDQPVGRALMTGQMFLDQFDEEVICASFCKLLRPKRSSILPELLLLHFQNIYDNKKIMQYQVQSTGITNFKFEHFLKNEKIILPSKELQNTFENIIEPIIDEIQILGVRNSNLCKTRGLLLPKLISGEIDVEDLNINTGNIQ